MNAWNAGLASPLIKFLKNPSDVQAIQDVYRCYSLDATVLGAIEENLLKNEAFRNLYEEWYSPKDYSLEKLSGLPPESFGAIYANHMIKNGLKLDFISEFETRNVMSYLWHRAKHVHDITHLITGFDTSLIGEAGVKGFELAQYLSPASAGILGAGIFSVSLLHPQVLGPMFDAVIEGYLMGREFPLLMGIKWDKEWETPFIELVRKYRLPRARTSVKKTSSS